MRMVSVIIPTLNEENTIREVIRNIPSKLLKRLGYECEIIVVDGGSTDKTVEYALMMNARVVRVNRRGYGLAYIVGFRYAKGDIIVTLDADMTYPPKAIPLLVRILEEYNLDFVTTNRFAKYDEGAFSPVRLAGNKLINILMYLLFGLNIKDTQSGMWCFRREILKKIDPKCYGMEFSTEIKLEAFRKVRSVEVPIHYRRREGGRSKIKIFKDGFRILSFLIYKRFFSFP